MPAQRNTRQRQLVLEAVQALRTHPTAEEIYTRVAQGCPGISRGTVYRNLALLAGQGHIKRVSHLNAADRFDFNTAPHYHFRCVRCGAVHDVRLPQMENLLERVDNPDGFEYTGYEITFTGLCPGCRDE